MPEIELPASSYRRITTAPAFDRFTPAVILAGSVLAMVGCGWAMLLWPLTPRLWPIYLVFIGLPAGTAGYAMHWIANPKPARPADPTDTWARWLRKLAWAIGLGLMLIWLRAH